jgi:hypothetical protein
MTKVRQIGGVEPGPDVLWQLDAEKAIRRTIQLYCRQSIVATGICCDRCTTRMPSTTTAGTRAM